MKIIAIIPARGGSKGIPRKNVRLMNGRPLIAYAIRTALRTEMITDVLVSTDDEEIADISGMYGAKVIQRPAHLAGDDVTLDPVIHHAVECYEKENGNVDVVITMQPTSPLLRAETFDLALHSFFEMNVDTMISAVNRPHLSWGEKDGTYFPLYEKRLNRQYLPKHLMETGAFVITKREFVTEHSRLGKNINLYEVPEDESVDIDDYADWTICEMRLNCRKIVIRTDGYPEIGLGHIYRSILLFDNLTEHEVVIVVSEKSGLGMEKLDKRFIRYKVVQDDAAFVELLKQERPDVLINDILDTSEAYMLSVKPWAERVVNIEDMGEGGHLADAVINALYEKGGAEEQYFWGHRYYCLRDEFLITEPKPFSGEVRQVLVVFGGTDPGRYTEKVLHVIRSMPADLPIIYQFVLGLGFNRDEEFAKAVAQCEQDIRVIKDVKVISTYMAESDIAISSQGRTMYELATMKVPTIILAQNDRETTHEFGYMKNGFINLGNGSEVEEDTLRETLLWLIHTPQIRRQMKESMEKLNLSGGIRRVKRIILESNK
ncbi:MAG: acylneuraminate cytidylyltransferase [Lachnospiraceae bacterium]|nr:acylneuraminate cytidylyltransferase [Lachnospiraceae bacterium]